MNDLTVELLLLLVGCLTSALGGLLLWRLGRIENNLVNIYAQLEEIKKEYVSHPFCDERHRLKN